MMDKHLCAFWCKVTFTVNLKSSARVELGYVRSSGSKLRLIVELQRAIQPLLLFPAQDIISSILQIRLQDQSPSQEEVLLLIYSANGEEIKSA